MIRRILGLLFAAGASFGLWWLILHLIAIGFGWHLLAFACVLTLVVIQAEWPASETHEPFDLRRFFRRH